MKLALQQRITNKNLLQKTHKGSDLGWNVAVIDRYTARMSIYDRAAPSYATVGPPLFSHFGSRLVERLDIKSGQRVLDVASGTGACSLPASWMVGVSGHVVAVDASLEMLRVARERLRENRAHNCSLAKMNAENLAVRSDSVDRVVCGFALDGFLEYEAVLSEIWRVLKDGGRFGSTVAPTWWWQGDSRWDWHVDLLRKLGYQVDTDLEKPWVPEQLRQTLKNAGFVDIRIEVEDFPLLFRDFDEWWKWIWSHGYRGVLETLGSREQTEYRQQSALNLGQREPIQGKLPVLLFTAGKVGRTKKRTVRA